MNGLTLTEWRERAGLTQADMAGLLGVSVRTIRRLETHVEEMRIRDLERYAAAVGVPVVVLCPAFLVTARWADVSRAR